MNSTRDYLQDILEELNDIIEFTTEGEAYFMEDVKTQKAVIRSYEVVGEICKRLDNNFREIHTQIDWRRLITFRDFLAHSYQVIALRYIWDAVKDVHNLRQTFQNLFESLPPDK
jgi:uncharacterized protein with HEPN domain